MLAAAIDTDVTDHADAQDPIHVHLLTELALADSRKLEVLPQAEVDHLKKQLLTLSQRVRQARSNLAIQIKYRDATSSANKLYSSRQLNSKSNSAAVSKSDDYDDVELEQGASAHQCEELAKELSSLERDLAVCNSKLLEHTAAVLALSRRFDLAHNGDDSGMDLGPGSPRFSWGYHALSPRVDGDDALTAGAQTQDNGVSNTANASQQPFVVQAPGSVNSEQRPSQLDRVEGSQVGDNAAQGSSLHNQPVNRNILNNKADALERLGALLVDSEAQLANVKAEIETATEGVLPSGEMAGESNKGLSRSRITKLQESLAGAIDICRIISQDRDQNQPTQERGFPEDNGNPGQLEERIQTLLQRLGIESDDVNMRALVQDWLNTERLAATASQGRSQTTSFLSEQFRITLREQRKKFHAELAREVRARQQLEQRVKMLQNRGG